MHPKYIFPPQAQALPKACRHRHTPQFSRGSRLYIMTHFNIAEGGKLLRYEAYVVLTCSHRSSPDFYIAKRAVAFFRIGKLLFGKQRKQLFINNRHIHSERAYHKYFSAVFCHPYALFEHLFKHCTQMPYGVIHNRGIKTAYMVKLPKGLFPICKLFTALTLRAKRTF